MCQWPGGWNADLGENRVEFLGICGLFNMIVLGWPVRAKRGPSPQWRIPHQPCPEHHHKACALCVHFEVLALASVTILVQNLARLEKYVTF